MSDESSKKCKRSFVEAWLTDDRFKSWIRRVPSDNSVYYCSVCNKTFSCQSRNISKHADSTYHKNNIKKSHPHTCDNNENNLVKKSKSVFRLEWLHIDEFKHWLREVPNDDSLCYCLICDKSFACGLSQIYRHAETKTHINKCENSDERQSNEDMNIESNESLLSFNERTKEAEIRYAALIAEMNIPHQNANKILSFFQHVGKDSHVLRSMKMGRTKCKNIITNVLSKVETERVVENIQNTKFSIFIDETSDICNEKWMTFQVRYPDPGTLDIRTQLVVLINIDAKDSSAEKLFNAFKNEMYKLQVPFSNIIALSCDNASVMIGKHVSFQKKLEKECPRLLTFPCPCHSAALAAHAASDKIPEICDRFTKMIVNYINSSPKRSAVFSEFCECFEGKSLKLLKLSDTRWLSHHACVERLLKYWDTIKHFLHEAVVSEKTKVAEDLLSIMNNVETKAYFLFLEYVLNFFNQFNAYFQASQTRIHVLQSKCLQFLYNMCRHFLKVEHLKPFSINMTFSLKENQKSLDEINLGNECEEYLNELKTQGHEDVVTTVRQNCLTFYVTAAEEIRKRLPVNNIFLSKLKVFQYFETVCDIDREKSFNDVVFIAKTIGGFDEEALKKEWTALPLDFTEQEKQSFSILNFDDMWKKILRPTNVTTRKYPNLTNLVNAVRSLPNSNADPERMFSLLSNIKNKKRNKLSSNTVNATCVFKSALNATGETCLSMMIDEKHLSLMSTENLYASTAKKDKSTLRLHAANVNDIAGPSWAD